MIFLYILFSSIIVSLLSLVGILFLFFKTNLFEKVIYYLVSFAGGILFGIVFFHILEETTEHISAHLFSFFLTIGFLTFFILERIIRWRHCHHLPQCEIHPVIPLNLLGDSLHNFIDGLTLAAGYLTSLETGLLITLGIIFHEIPQEIGDFAILVYGGYSRKKALFYNFITATVAVLGAISGYFFLEKFQYLLPFLLAIASGNFLYIASSDIIPELHRELSLKKSVCSFIIFILGILLINFLTNLFTHK
ncbi:MAG: ZIP family metal transporter [candidate division WOR-3 bacterium]|nr:ZIP family metal transporter [candidate division WOR-3 bacterium]MDW8114544.1 ZIP family metal transporter [candidate division WOR-3 bacterium]